jgi:uncharacterized protein YqeY
VYRALRMEHPSHGTGAAPVAFRPERDAAAGLSRFCFEPVCDGTSPAARRALPMTTACESIMSLKERITDDMKAAMRAKDSEKLLAIRMLLAALKQKEVDERITLDDAMVIAIVDKLIKQRKDSIEQFRKAARDDLADKEAAELLVLEAYLPQRLSAEEIDTAVSTIVASLGAKGPGDMGKVMGAVKQALAGKADMGLVSGAVKRALAG